MDVPATFGDRLRRLRKGKKLTLRELSEAVGVNYTYLSKIELGRAGCLPAADTIRTLAAVFAVDPLELLQLADRVPPELQPFSRIASARRFLNRAQEIASPDDWEALLELLESRQQGRGKDGRLAEEPEQIGMQPIPAPGFRPQA